VKRHRGLFSRRECIDYDRDYFGEGEKKRVAPRAIQTDKKKKKTFSGRKGGANKVSVLNHLRVVSEKSHQSNVGEGKKTGRCGKSLV